MPKENEQSIVNQVATQPDSVTEDPYKKIVEEENARLAQSLDGKEDNLFYGTRNPIRLG